MVLSFYRYTYINVILNSSQNLTLYIISELSLRSFLGYFSLNEHTGILILIKNLDREVLSEFNLEIRVYSLSNVKKNQRKRRDVGKYLFFLKFLIDNQSFIVLIAVF